MAKLTRTPSSQRRCRVKVWKFLEGDALLPTTPGVYPGPNPPFLFPGTLYPGDGFAALEGSSCREGWLLSASPGGYPVLALPTTSLCAGWGDGKAGMRNKQT